MTEEQHLEFERAKPKPQVLAEKYGRKPREKKSEVGIPVLPPMQVDLDEVRKPDQRAVACVNMRLAGTPWPDVTRELGYATVSTAKAAYISALAHMYPQEASETLRHTEALRAEQQLRRSVAMASADYLIVHEEDEDGNVVERRVPNAEKLRWHEQAGKDLALHALITGAKAPSRIEISATVQELNAIASELIAAETAGDIEADIFDLDEIEAEVVEED